MASTSNSEKFLAKVKIWKEQGVKVYGFIPPIDNSFERIRK